MWTPMETVTTIGHLEEGKSKWLSVIYYAIFESKST